MDYGYLMTFSTQLHAVCRAFVTLNGVRPYNCPPRTE